MRSNADGDVIGVTIVNARGLLDRDGKITITIPERIDVSAAALAPAMSSPAAWPCFAGRAAFILPRWSSLGVALNGVAP